jgi:hypothetical protein
VKNRRHGSTPSFDDVSDIAAPLFQGCFVASENHFVEQEIDLGRLLPSLRWGLARDESRKRGALGLADAAVSVAHLLTGWSDIQPRWPAPLMQSI